MPCNHHPGAQPPARHIYGVILDPVRVQFSENTAKSSTLPPFTIGQAEAQNPAPPGAYCTKDGGVRVPQRVEILMQAAMVLRSFVLM